MHLTQETRKDFKMDYLIIGAIIVVILAFICSAVFKKQVTPPKPPIEDPGNRDDKDKPRIP